MPLTRARATDIENALGGTIKGTVFPSEQFGKAVDHHDVAALSIINSSVVICYVFEPAGAESAIGSATDGSNRSCSARLPLESDVIRNSCARRSATSARPCCWSPTNASRGVEERTAQSFTAPSGCWCWLYLIW